MQPKEKHEIITELIDAGDEFSLKKAERKANAWIGSEPTNPNPHILLGLIHAEKGNYQKAASCLKKSRTIAPSNYLAWINEAFVLLASGEYKSAEASAKKALQFSNAEDEKTTSHFYIGCSLIELYRFEEASETFHESGIVFSLCSTLIAQGLYNETLAIFKSANMSPGGQMTLPSSLGSGAEKGPVHKVLESVTSELLRFAHEGYTPDQIMSAIDLPPGDIEPGTPEYIEWWKNEIEDEFWEDEVRETLELLVIPGMREKLLEEVPEDELIDASELDW